MINNEKCVLYSIVSSREQSSLGLKKKKYCCGVRIKTAKQNDSYVNNGDADYPQKLLIFGGKQVSSIKLLLVECHLRFCAVNMFERW